MRLEDWIDRHDDVDNPLIPAATVVLLRDGPRGLETLMMRRNSQLSFAEGMWVFPGGRIDVDDGPADDPERSARGAAVRECKEEADLDVVAGDLVHYSHWIPPAQAPKRFSTWFFLAKAPEGAVTVDQGEITDHAWWAPHAALERAHDRLIEILPPTWITLFDLGQFDDADAALLAAADRGVRTYATRVAKTADGRAAVWEGDAAYETGSDAGGGPRHRLVMGESGWQFHLD